MIIMAARGRSIRTVCGGYKDGARGAPYSLFFQEGVWGNLAFSKKAGFPQILFLLFPYSSANRRARASASAKRVWTAASVRPAPRAMRSAWCRVMRSEGLWESVLTMREAPTSRAIRATWPLARAVAFAGRDLQKDAPLPGPGGFLQGDEAGVGQDVDVGLDGGPVGARGHRLRQALAVDHDERHPQGPGLGGQGADEGRGQVGELQARDEHRVVAPVEAQGRGFQAGEDHLEVGGIHVVGDGEIAVALHLGPAPELRRNQLAVAVQGMRMEVYHKGGFSVFGFSFLVKKQKYKDRSQKPSKENIIFYTISEKIASGEFIRRPRRRVTAGRGAGE